MFAAFYNPHSLTLCALGGTRHILFFYHLTLTMGDRNYHNDEEVDFLFYVPLSEVK